MTRGEKIAVGLATVGAAAVVIAAAALGALIGAIREFEHANEIPWDEWEKEL